MPTRPDFTLPFVVDEGGTLIRYDEEGFICGPLGVTRAYVGKIVVADEPDGFPGPGSLFLQKCPRRALRRNVRTGRWKIVREEHDDAPR